MYMYMCGLDSVSVDLRNFFADIDGYRTFHTSSQNYALNIYY